MRRFVRANRLRFLWTLTFATAERSYTGAGAAWDALARRFREELRPFPWAAVFEPHPGGHGWHIHFATDRFLPIENIRKWWGRGQVNVGDGRSLKGRKPPRQMARYLGKYVAKTFVTAAEETDGEPLGLGVTPRRPREHRYRVPQGFSPEVVRRYFGTPERAYTWLVAAYGEPIEGIPFSISAAGQVDGYWLDFPDRLLHPPPLVRLAA